MFREKLYTECDLIRSALFSLSLMTYIRSNIASWFNVIIIRI